MPDAPNPPGTLPFQNFTGGGYFFLDNKDRIWSATKTSHLFVLAERNDGHSLVKVADYDLSKVLKPSERISSALPDFSGRIWFVSKKDGVIGVLDPRTGKIKKITLGEEVENSFAVDRDGVYIASDKRMYRFDAGKDLKPRVTWKVNYQNSGIHKPSQIDAGTGTTPTIMPNGMREHHRQRRPDERRRLPHRNQAGQGPEAHGVRGARLRQGRERDREFAHRRPAARCSWRTTTATRTRSGPTPGPRPPRVRPRRRQQRRQRLQAALDEHDRRRAVGGRQGLDQDRPALHLHRTDRSQRLTAVVLGGHRRRTGKEAWRKLAGTGFAFNNNYAGLSLGPDGTAYVGTFGGLQALRDA